jgi:formylglycine-generating enzyme required for sulfatase activity
MDEEYRDKLEQARQSARGGPRPSVSAKRRRRLEQESLLRQKVSISWLETLLTNTEDSNTSLKDLSSVFVRHYSAVEQSTLLIGASCRQLRFVEVEYARHHWAVGEVPPELRCAYIAQARRKGESEEQQQEHQNAKSQLARAEMRLQSSRQRLDKAEAETRHLRPAYNEQLAKVAAHRQLLERSSSILSRITQQYTDQQRVLQKERQRIERELGSRVRNAEVEAELASADILLEESELPSLRRCLASAEEAIATAWSIWLQPFGLSSSPSLPLVQIPAGTRWRGSAMLRNKDERPLRSIHFSRSIAMGVTPVTQGLYVAVCGYNPSNRNDLSRPVETVSWFDALQFCNALSRMEGFSPAYILDESNQTARWRREVNGYRLPTEAEWESAARASDGLEFSGSDEPERYAWSVTNARSKTQRVRTRRPNAWGLYGMSGNVWEWCWDWYDCNYYDSSPKEDPAGPDRGSRRVVRGGAAISTRDKARVSNRYSLPPDLQDAYVGFRIVRNQ